MKTHSYKEVTDCFICHDCNYIGENQIDIDVHIGRNHTSYFYCGLCDFEAENLEKLEIHLFTCEVYLCLKCNKKFNTLSNLKSHIGGTHEEDYIRIIHAKLDRRNQEQVVSSYYRSRELFS